MFHTCALSVALSQTANVAMTAIQDDIITRSATTGAFILPEDMMLFGCQAMSATLNRVRFSSASLRQINQPHIRPIIRSALPRDLERIQVFLDQPFRLKANEELTLEATSDLAVGAETAFAILWFGVELAPIPPGDIITARCTAVATHVAAAWTTIAFTQDQTLPPGRYALVGSECISTTGIAHRWIIPNQFYRPGVLSGTAIGNRGVEIQNNRRFGSFGTFLNTALPQLQVLSSAADTADTIYMQLVKVE